MLNYLESQFGLSGWIASQLAHWGFIMWEKYLSCFLDHFPPLPALEKLGACQSRRQRTDGDGFAQAAPATTCFGHAGHVCTMP